MGLLQRRSSSSSDTQPELCGGSGNSMSLSLGYGDGRMTPLTNTVTRAQSTGSHDRRSPPQQQRKRASLWMPTRKSLTSSSPRKSPRSSSMFAYDPEYHYSTFSKGSAAWLLKTIYAAALLSWIIARFTTGGGQYYSSIISGLESQEAIVSNQIQQILDGISKVRDVALVENQRFQELKETRQALDHEVRVLSEMKDSKSKMGPKPKQGMNTEIVQKWLENRKQTLMNKVKKLQHYLQESSQRLEVEK